MAAIKLECMADSTSGYPAGFVGICIHELEQSTKGFLLERSVSTNEAILYYRPRPQAYALERLALIYLDSNQATAAGDAAAAALKIAPNSPTALIVLAAQLEKTDPVQAIALYKKAIESASTGNPSISAFRYLELPRAYAGIARLEPKR